MHGPSLATLLVVATLGLAQPSPGGTSDALAEARRKLGRDDATAAVAILESALPEVGPGKDKDAVLDLLQKAYEAAARQAEQAGRAKEAETYRENLKILNRRTRPARPAPPSEPRTPVAEPLASPAEATPPLFDPTAKGPSPLPEGPTPPTAPPALPEISAPAPTAPDEPIPTPPSAGLAAPLPTESAPPAGPQTAPPSDLATADAAFVAKDYPAAGRIYGALAVEKRLPRERLDQWLYCREAVIKDRINARPKSEAEWVEIKADLGDIQAIDPNNLLAEYLQNVVKDHHAAWKKRKPTKAMVVRGSAPEEPAAPARPARTVSNANGNANPTASAADPSLKSASAVSSGSVAASKTGANVGRWQVHDSANFRIYHVDPALAAKVAQVAEAARRDLGKRWASKTARASWQPPCEIYLYPTARQYAQMTGQPEDSPGFSTMGMNAGRIISRRINLRTDHPALVLAVLPHEITHVILADHFTEQQIPRWADEGLAVLSEPADEQQRRAVDLVTPLGENRLFTVDALMGMDYPDNRYWGLYYAQSVSLTRFLVEQSTPAQMIQFLQDSQREGYEPALRRLYQIDGFPDLQRRWLAYARAKVDTKGVASAPPTGPDLKVR